MKKLNSQKGSQSTDVPVRVLKDNAGIFADYVCGFFNESILKRANITPVFKNVYRRS